VAVADAEDERHPLERVDIALARRKAMPVAERRTQVARHVPVLDAIAVLVLVERVVAVLQIRAVEHHHEREQSTVRPRADEGVLPPGPYALAVQRLFLEPESPARFRARAPVVLQLERGEVVHHRLVVADPRQQA
jgi:hypothetical protein